MEKVLVFLSDAVNISKVETFVDEFCRDYSIAEDLYGNILISTLEAVNNAIAHGNAHDPTKTVEVKAVKGEKFLTVSVKDQGRGFDYSKLPDPTLPENIEAISGRGIFLINNLADKVEFADNGSLIIMNFIL